MSVLNLPSIEGKTAMITGGTRGLGKAIALKFAEAGCRLIAVSSISGKEEDFLALGKQLKAFDVDFMSCRSDVGNREETQLFFDKFINRYGRIDILVNNAAACAEGTFLDITEMELDRILDVNLKGTFYCMQEALKYMTDAGTGSIINISSTAGITGGSVGPQYGASKAGVIALTQSAGRAYAKYGIRVNAVAPGDMETDMLLKVFSSDEQKRERLEKIPLGRIAEPEEIANVVLFLASPLSSYIIGETIRVSGGRI